MDAANLSALLRACTVSNDLARGKLLHCKTISLGLQNNNFVCKTLVNLYLFFRLFEDAQKVLVSVLHSTDISIWNGVLAAYSKNQKYKSTLRLFCKLGYHLSHVRPDSYTFPSVLKACGGLNRAGIGEMIHCSVLKSGFGADIVVSSSLVGMYAKCNRYEFAIQIFNQMTEKDVACWNTIMSCYYQSGQVAKALEMFEKMKISGFRPDSVSFTTALSSCARLVDLDTGMRIHEELVMCNLQLDVFVSSAIVDMYAKCGSLERAMEVFERIPNKTVVCWNSMIGGYSLRGDCFSCLQLFSRMHVEGVRPTSTTISTLLIAFSRRSSFHFGKIIHAYLLRTNVECDIYVTCSLLDFYFKCGSIKGAETIFNNIDRSNTVSWNVMISGYTMVGCYFKAIDIFSEMKSHGVRADSITFTSVLSSCAQVAALEQGREIHKEISLHQLENNEMVMSALLDMYAKSGAVKEAKAVFNKLLSKDVVSYTSMIMAYGSHSQPREALDLFSEMQKSGLVPDRVTFIAVLSACSHGGLVDEGKYVFNKMTLQYGLEPGIEHYSCLVDLLGRLGRVYEAYAIIQETPSIKADAGILGSLFSACTLHKILEVGEEVARLLLDLDPDDHSTYISLANIYASVGRWDDARKVRTMIKEKGLRKNPGCSWIEIDKRIHQFFAKDDSCAQSGLTHELLGTLSQHMKKNTFESLEEQLEQCYGNY